MLPVSSKSDTAASLSHVSVTYGDGAAAVCALEDVSLEIERGKLTLLMGPSGSGKTTLLQVLGCLRRAESGEICVEGKMVSDLAERDLSTVRRQQLGFVFQQYNLLPTLRAWENVAVALELQGERGRKIEGRSRDLLARLGLEDRSDAFPSELSGGQKQRVAIARALVGGPRIILADEPTAALDAAAGLNVGRVLRELAEEHGRAVVVVTHDSRLEPFAHRVILLEDGKIVAPIRAPELRFVQLSRRIQA